MKEQRIWWDSIAFRSRFPLDIIRTIKHYSREAKIECDLSLRSQIRDFIIFSKNLLDHEIDDDSLAFIFQCSETTVIRAKNEDLSLKKPTMRAPTILDKEETNEVIDWIKKEQIN